MHDDLRFELILPIQAHAEMIRTWRNDPQALAMSLTYTEPKSLEDFFGLFKRSYYSYPKLPPLFAIYQGQSVGALRFDPAQATEEACEISLIVAKEHRGQGLGTAILQTIDTFLIRQGIHKIVARIKKNNTASIQTFTKAGYQLIKSDEILHYEKKLSASEELAPVFIIAEAGSNWKTDNPHHDLNQALRMIDVAKEAGADAVKFQMFRAESTYVSKAGISHYLAKQGIQKDIGDLLKALEMPEKMIAKLVEHCLARNIEFMSSVFSEENFQWIDPFVKRHKIASYEISHLHLIECVAKSYKPLILSTGASEVSDIDWAVDTFYHSGGKALTLLQCTAKYPADNASMNLNTIPWLKNRYQVKVGLSDHSLHPLVAPLGAVALGASVIEKHFTLSRALKGPDHAFAIEPSELQQMVQMIRMMEQMRGVGVKWIQAEEKELYFFARRGLQALRDIQTGEILSEDKNIAILRPGTRKLGLHPRYLTKIEGKPALRNIAQGEGIQLQDFEDI